MISFIFMCLLLPVNSVFIIKDNIIPQELREDRKCKGGLVLSKFKPDEYVPISCANIRFQQSDKQDYVFRSSLGVEINSATTSPTEYLAVYEDGICKMKAVELQDTYMGDMYDKIHSESGKLSLINSYGYCKENEVEDDQIYKTRHNRDMPFKLVNDKSCEFYGYRSSYSENECSVYSRETVSDTLVIPDDIMTHDDKISSFDQPWGCVYNDTAKLNVFDADDIELGAENKSYSDRNNMYSHLLNSKLTRIRNLISSFYGFVRQISYIRKNIDLGLNEYARPSQAPQLAGARHRYTEFIDSLPPKYMPYPTGREDDWRIEYNEIYFTYSFVEHYNNLTNRWGAMYYEEELYYRIHLQLMKDTLVYIDTLKNADVKMRNLFERLKNVLNSIEDEQISVDHLVGWMRHMQIGNGDLNTNTETTNERLHTTLANAKDIIESNSVRIKEILDDMDFEDMKNVLKNIKGYAKEILYNGYVELSNERYKPIDLNKRALHYPDEVRIVFGKVINGVVQIPEDYESDPRYIRYEDAMESNWKDTYDLMSVRLLEDPLRHRDEFSVNGVTVVDFDTVADTAVQNYEQFYAEANTSFVVESLQEYRYVRTHALTLFNPHPFAEPKVTDDRYESRVNIHNQIVNLEHEMIQNDDRNLTNLLSLHRQYISQPPLCNDDTKCLCYETYTDKNQAIADCMEICPKAFRHFWDQTEPRLTSKILVHDRSECLCMRNAFTELKCVLQGRQWINELFVSQYDILTHSSVRRDTVYEDTYLYCKMMDCVAGRVDEPCLYSGGVCEEGWFDGNCNVVGACDGFTYEDCTCGSIPCKAGKYCTQAGVCKNIVPKDDKKLLYLNHISRI